MHRSQWKFGKRQLVAILTGVLICVILVSLILIPASYSEYSSSYISSIVITCVLLGLALVTPEFLGAVFGPWVGLGIGSLGSLMSYVTAMNLDSLFRTGTLAPAYDYTYPFHEYWPIPLGLASVGFISRFAMFKMKGRYNIRRTLGFSSLGAVVGTVFALTSITIISYIGYPDYYNFSSNFFIPLIIVVPIYVGLGLILLPPLLVAYREAPHG